jgi:hypothetical protein
VVEEEVVPLEGVVVEGRAKVDDRPCVWVLLCSLHVLCIVAQQCMNMAW